VIQTLGTFGTMNIVAGVVLLVAGLLLPLAAYKNKVGQLGFGTPEAMARRRALVRVQMLAASPVLILIGIVVLSTGLRD